MFLKKLSLLNYKNLAQIEFDFEAKINCFVGKNGVGKTNILDASYHLAEQFGQKVTICQSNWPESYNPAERFGQ